MKQILFLLLALLPLSLQKFCLDCFRCPAFMEIACKPIVFAEGFSYGMQCNCFHQNFKYEGDYEGYEKQLTCYRSMQWATCYHRDKASPQFSCQCERD